MDRSVSFEHEEKCSEQQNSSYRKRGSKPPPPHSTCEACKSIRTMKRVTIMPRVNMWPRNRTPAWSWSIHPPAPWPRQNWITSTPCHLRANGIHATTAWEVYLRCVRSNSQSSPIEAALGAVPSAPLAAIRARPSVPARRTQSWPRPISCVITTTSGEPW